MTEPKIWTEQEITDLLESRVKAVEKAVIAIFKRQTYTEQMTETTIVKNGVGFSSYDAKLGTYLATYLMREGNRLTGKFKAKGLKLVLKYRRQITDIANLNELRKVA